MAGHGFGRYGLLPAHAIAATDRLQHIQHCFQFRLRLSLKHCNQLWCGKSRLGEHRSQYARQLKRQLLHHPSDAAIHGHHRQAAQPLHRHAAGGVLESEALQQFAALGCMNEEAQGAVLSPLAARGGAWFMQGWECLRLELARAGLADIALQCLLQPVFR